MLLLSVSALGAVSFLAWALILGAGVTSAAASILSTVGLIALFFEVARQKRIVRFTESGKRMSHTVLTVDRRMERELAARIGARNVAALKRLLSLEW